MGGAAFDNGWVEQAETIFRHVVGGFLKDLPSRSPEQVELALTVLYQQFVKKVETEEHVRSCFQAYTDPVSAYARRFQKPPAKGGNVGFILATSERLGHTEALIELVNHLPFKPYVYVLKGVKPLPFENIVYLESQNFTDMIENLRDHMVKHEVGTMVWVSAPAVAPLILPMRLAEKQVFWTLKFHPFQLPEIDVHLTYGEDREVHGEKWIGVPFLTKRPEYHLKPKKPFSEPYLYGTLARTEKYTEPFLIAVCRILKAKPEAGYIWAGRMQSEAVQAVFEREGVSDRTHFIGWVDVPEYVRIMDCFLETFPFGCGLTGIEAIAAGTPLVSMKGDYTLSGMYKFDGAKSVDDYVERALNPKKLDVYDRIARPELMAEKFVCSIS